MPIEKIKARQIFDCRGEPTLEVDVITDIGLLRSSVSCTHSPTPNEAVELRDNDESKFNGRSVLRAVDNVNKIIGPELVKSRLEVCQQREIDSLMNRLDGTSDKSKLGANAILGVSMACCKAGAIKKGVPLYKYISQLAESKEPIIPVPVFTIISGGKLSGNPLPCQEFVIMPTGAVSFAEAMKMGYDVYRAIEKLIAESQELKLPLTVGDEGAFSPEFEEDREALVVITDAIKGLGYEGRVKIAMDMAASSFCKDGQYDLAFKTDESDPDDYMETEALKDQYLDLLREFPQIVSLEDPFDQEDWDGWGMLADQPIQLLADDLTAMNIERIEEAMEKQSGNGIVIRLSQIGTITEAIDCHKMARAGGWSSVVSTGYGETEDNFIADFAVGLAAGQFKAGAPCRGERVSKYNQILRIEEELGKDAIYAGEMFRNPLQLAEKKKEGKDKKGKDKKKKK
ncbi:enolase-like [Diachasma alloeum]|uniref:enolase-like n=1 Tax=Diachasma alloeum TaxID=454923 RepID=UPI0007383717|nr:enolase-like [Diachasma alloeum]